jgi:hypothetical protein
MTGIDIHLKFVVVCLDNAPSRMKQLGIMRECGNDPNGGASLRLTPNAFPLGSFPSILLSSAFLLISLAFFS